MTIRESGNMRVQAEGPSSAVTAAMTTASAMVADIATYTTIADASTDSIFVQGLDKDSDLSIPVYLCQILGFFRNSYVTLADRCHFTCTKYNHCTGR